jgi:hypothetical protein
VTVSIAALATAGVARYRMATAWGTETGDL